MLILWFLKELFGVGDAIGPSANNVHFHDQPGYRYYLALIISLLGQEDRLLQLVNMFVYLTALFSVLLFNHSTW